MPVIVPHGAPEGYEWFVALMVLVGLYFAFAISCGRGADGSDEQMFGAH
jgi:hypothetical protein